MKSCWGNSIIKKQVEAWEIWIRYFSVSIIFYIDHQRALSWMH